MSNTLAEREALKKIVEHNRDYFKCDITIPLGNTALKKVHTNQFLFSSIPDTFNLVNWALIAKKLNANVNRYEGYVKNRWYIESCDISVEAGGDAKMKLGLNAFASSYQTYTDGFKGMMDTYNQQTKQNTTSNNGTSATQTTSNAVTTQTSVINSEWVKKYSVPSVVVNKIKEICKVGNTQEQNVKIWFNWMDKHIGYVGYTDHQRSIQTVMSKGGGNCVDNSRTFRAGCHALGVKCNFVQGFSCCANGECANHQWNKVYLNGKGITVDTGRSYASWGSHWGNCSGGTSETTSGW